jgi:hypothetical protein
MSTPIIWDRHDKVSMYGQDGFRYRCPSTMEVVDPINLPANEVFTTAEVVTDAQDVTLSIPVKFINEALESI